MARVPYLDRDDLAPEHRHLLDRPINLRRALANHPRALEVFSPPGQWIRHEAPLDSRLREMAIIQVGYVTASAYEFSHHVKIGADFGVTEADMEALVAETHGRDSALPELDRAVLAAARELTLEVSLADETWATIESGLGREHAMELVFVIAHYNHVVRLLAALRIDVEPEWAEPLERYSPPEGAGGWR